MIKTHVASKLANKYSPEPIAGKVKKVVLPCVSHERIYQHVWSNKKQGGELYKSLHGCCWTFSVLNAPSWFEADSYDGYRPVSGNRQFGLRDNGYGSFTFYTQGVDKLTGVWHALANASLLLDAFAKADELYGLVCWGK